MAPKGYVGLWVKEEKKIKLIPPNGSTSRRKGNMKLLKIFYQQIIHHANIKWGKRSRHVESDQRVTGYPSKKVESRRG